MHSYVPHYANNIYIHVIVSELVSVTVGVTYTLVTVGSLTVPCIGNSRQTHPPTNIQNSDSLSQPVSYGYRLGEKNI